MDYFCFIQSVVSYVENRLKSDIDYSDIESVTGFSLQHARAVFKACTRMPLARYVLNRKVSNAAFDIIYTGRNLLDIALDYGFDSYDTFTRAFRRIAGVTPREFRKKGFQVGRIKLTAGMYGPGVITGVITGERMSHAPLLDLEENISMKTVEKSEDSCILFGVPKVRYSFEECTPFPSALKACLNYMGQKISYSYLMAASGAAFRLRWNTTRWDGGNVGIAFIYENPNEAYERSFKAAGRSCRILERKQGVKKNDFVGFIKSEIDEGRPVIAVGIIGPPEACIVTGYRDSGNTLLGWSFFQDNPQFAKDCETDESGYFICRNWWENPCTAAVISIGEEKEAVTGLKEILQNAVEVLTKERVGSYAGGQAAFDAWAKVLSDDSQFPEGAVLPLLFERLVCQTDAMVMIGEGRSYAGCFMEWVAGRREEVRDQCTKAAGYFKAAFPVINLMREQLGGWQQGEVQAKRLADPAVRKEIARLVMKVKQLDSDACDCLKDIVAKIK